MQSIKKAQSASIHSFATNSVLKQGKFVKIKIANSGIYKLTFDDLNSMGVTPANVRIFGYGGAVLEQSFLQSKMAITAQKLQSADLSGKNRVKP